MDNSSLISGIIILLVILLPVLYLGMASNRKQKKLTEDLLKKVKEKGLNINQHELWKKSILALDTDQNKLFYQKDYENSQTEAIIDLNQYARCKSINHSRNVKSSNGNYQMVDRLELELFNKNSSLNSTKIEFYDSNKNFHLDNELELLSKWARILEKRIH